MITLDYWRIPVHLKKEEEERPWRARLQRLYLNHSISLIHTLLKPILLPSFSVCVIGTQRLEFFNLSISLLKYPTDLVSMYFVGRQLKKGFNVFTNASNSSYNLNNLWQPESAVGVFFLYCQIWRTGGLMNLYTKCMGLNKGINYTAPFMYINIRFYYLILFRCSWNFVALGWNYRDGITCVITQEVWHLIREFYTALFRLYHERLCVPGDF